MLGRVEVDGGDGLVFLKLGEEDVVGLGQAGDFEEAVEDEGAAGGAEGGVGRRVLGVGRGDDGDGGAVPLRGGHLAGDGTAPDEVVEAELLVVELAAELAGGERDVGGADGLVGFLCRLVGGLVEVGLVGEVVLAELVADVAAEGVEGLAREVGRVGPHVGDEAGLAAGALEVDALVELLGDAHGAAEVEAQAGGGLLLQSGGDEGGAGATGGALGLDSVDGEAHGSPPGNFPGSPPRGGGGFGDVSAINDPRLRGTLRFVVGPGVLVVQHEAQRLRGSEGGVAVGGVELLAVELGELGLEAAVVAEPGVLVFHRFVVLIFAAPGRADKAAPGVAERRRLVERRGEQAGDLPVLVGHEGVDLPLALHDQSRRHRLHPPGAQPPRDLLPQQRADLVPHDPVEDAAGLLRIDAVQLQRPRSVEGPLDFALGDGVEDYPLGPVDGVVQRVGDVPGDGLALAVEVGGEPDVGRLLGRLLQLADGLLARGHDLVGRLEVVLEVHPRHRPLDPLGVPGGQVADVADAGHHDVVAAEVLVDRLGLGGRLDDDQVLARGVGGLGRGAAGRAFAGRLFTSGGFLGHRGSPAATGWLAAVGAVYI